MYLGIGMKYGAGICTSLISMNRAFKWCSGGYRWLSWKLQNYVLIGRKLEQSCISDQLSLHHHLPIPIRDRVIRTCPSLILRPLMKAIHAGVGLGLGPRLTCPPLKDYTTCHPHSGYEADWPACSAQVSAACTCWPVAGCWSVLACCWGPCKQPCGLPGI